MPGYLLRFLVVFGVLSVLGASACQYTQKIRDGATAIERKQYSLAYELLKKEYKKEKSRVERGKLAYLLGEALTQMQREREAATWFKTAYDYQYGVEALKAYAYALKQSEQYREALQAFKELGIEVGSPYEYQPEMKACEQALQWLQARPKNFETEPLPCNSPAADYGLSLFGLSGDLLFTSDRGRGEEAVYLWTGRAFSDLYLAKADEADAVPLPEPINTKDNEGAAFFHAPTATLYFTRCSAEGKFEDRYCKIWMSHYREGKWSTPEMLPFQKERVNYGQPAMTEDGSRLYFSSNDPEGWGGYDLYYVEPVAGGGWSEPRLLSRAVNTPNGDEQFPLPEKDTLYFASTGHAGMGGLDLFRSYQLQPNRWTPARNMKPPINSGADDFGLCIQRDEKGRLAGYFTSNRPNEQPGGGGDDLWRFWPSAAFPEQAGEAVDTSRGKWVLELYALENVYVAPDDPASEVLARKPLAHARVSRLADGKEDHFMTSEEGLVELPLTEETDYRFVVSKEGYLKSEAVFSSKGLAAPLFGEERLRLEVVLQKVFLDREIVLPDIYYDFDRWEIREDAKPALNRLARELQLNPDIRIRLNSHTDCRGSARYNQELSEKRARAAVDYLISLGIDPERLEAKGFGESQPRVDCSCSRCTEEEHQLNRRTSFSIIGM